MADLSTQWLGLALASPVVVAASPVADDVSRAMAMERAGAGAVIARSVFEEQYVDEQLAAHALFDGRMDADAEARTMLAESARWVFEPIAYVAQVRALKGALGVPVIGSLNGVSPGGWVTFATALEEAGADAIELNLYELGANPDEEGAAVERRQLAVVRAVCAAASVPVTVKLSPSYASVPSFARRVKEAGARGVTLFNRFMQPDIDLENLEVAPRGRLSDASELPVRLHGLALLSGRVDLELAASGGVHSGDDACKCVLSGASVVQVASALLERGPDAMRAIVEGLSRRLDAMGYSRAEHARGVLSLSRAPDPAKWERLQYMRALQGWPPRRGGP
jgi:dihydroorotate dehydrogenase (fumarate)